MGELAPHLSRSSSSTSTSLDASGRERVGAPPRLANLRTGLGNRGFGRYVRTLARDDREKSVTVYLAGPPPPVHAAQRATAENAELAKYIDEMDKLSKDELRKRREAEAFALVSPSEGSHRSHELALEATEYIAKRRGLGQMYEVRYPDVPSRSPGTMRFNVRVMIEMGIRETGSFKKALDRLPDNDVIAPYAAYWKSEGKEFAFQFKRQAYITARRMLEGSDQAIDRVLQSYGIPVDKARAAASRVGADADLDTEAAWVVGQATISENVDDPKKEAHRRELAVQTGKLKALQKQVADLHLKANRADMDRPPNQSDPRWKKAYEAHVALAHAQGELDSLWIATERLHPVLAAFRRGGDIEKVELGALDSDFKHVEDEMKAVVKEILPKIADISKAKDRILRPGADTSPLAIPTVVALTRGNMFIPAGSLRDGIAADVVAEATGADSWLATIGVIALALVSLLPGGLLIASLAGTAIAAYDATREYDEYTKQKTFANTNLDIARALTTSDPSLTRFAVSLVSLGFEAIPLAQAFNEVRRMKQLVTAGEDATAAVRELNALGKTHDAPDLGEQVLRDIKQEQKLAKAASEAEGAGTKTAKKAFVPPPRDPELPSNVFTGAYASSADLEKDLTNALSGLNHGTTSPNPDMVWVRGVLHEAPDTSTNWQLLKVLDPYYETVRSPQKAAGFARHLYEVAAEKRITVRRALEEFSSGAATPTRVTGNLSKADLLQDAPFVDLNFLAGDPHGRYTHMFMEGMIDYYHGSGSGRRFRHLIARSTGPKGASRRGKEFWETVWDAMYDDESGRHINRPEMLGPLLQKMLGLPL